MSVTLRENLLLKKECSSCKALGARQALTVMGVIFSVLLMLPFIHAEQKVFTPYDIDKGFKFLTSGEESLLFEKPTYDKNTDKINLKLKQNKEIIIKTECPTDPNAKDQTCKGQTTINPKEYKPEFTNRYSKESLFKENNNVFENKNEQEYFLGGDCKKGECKIGKNSIIIVPEGDYDSTNTNVTDETGYARLNMTTGGIYDNLVLYYSFDVNETGVTDLGPGEIDGTYAGNAFYTDSGFFGGGLEVEKPGASYVDIPNYQFTDEMFLSFWVNVSAYNGVWTMLLGDSSNLNFFGFWDSSGGLVRLRPGSGGYDADWAYDLSVHNNQWTHFGIRFSDADNQAELFINGTSLGNKTTNGFGFLLERFGYSFNTVGYQPDAVFDEFMAFNGTVSASDVLAIYNNQSERFLPTGVQSFENANFSTNTTITNVTIDSCTTLLESRLTLEVEGNSYNFTNCEINEEIILSSSIVDLNITYIAGNNSFYTPIVIGNVTFTSVEPSPSVSIQVFSPENTTYYVDSTIPLEVSGVNIDNWFYSLNGASNTSFSPNSSFTAIEGLNNITVYGNGSLGIAEEEIYFTYQSSNPPTPDDTLGCAFRIFGYFDPEDINNFYGWCNQ